MNVRKNRKRTDHSGSTFDSFLQQEGIREEVEAVAIKRVLAWRLEQAMQKQQKTKQAVARQLHTSRSQLDRLLDPRNVPVTLDSITRAARALGKRVITASDIDVLVIGKPESDALAEALRKLERQLGREINSTVLSRKELESRRGRKDAFLGNVRHNKRLLLVGAEKPSAR